MRAGRGVPSTADIRLKYTEAWRLLPKTSRGLDQVGREAEGEASDWNADSGWRDFWKDVPGVELGPPPAAQVGASSGVPRDALVGAERDLRDLVALTTPSWYAGAHHTRIDLDYELDRDEPAASVDAVFMRTDQVLSHLMQLRRFYQALPHARRALANVSSLMMFDDHEISDDWNITRHWVESVTARALGRDLVSNGLTAYAVLVQRERDGAG